MSSETASEQFTIFPVFLLIDVSASMAGGPIEALNESLPSIKREMTTNHMVGEIARVSITTFSDVAETIVPLCDLAVAEIPFIEVQGGTNFGAGFRGVRKAIEDGLRSLPKGTPLYRPVVFFMSDGEHQAAADYADDLKHLRDPNWKFAPEIVAFGFGEAKAEPLRRVATRFAFITNRDADPASQLREIMTAIVGSIVTTSTSFVDPEQADGLHIEAPTEHFTPLPAFTLD